MYQFPEKDHWFENLAVRSNDMILATELTEPKLWLVDPSSTSLAYHNEGPGSETMISLVHEFPEYLGLLRVAEYRPDAFAIVAGNSSIAGGFKNYPAVIQDTLVRKVTPDAPDSINGLELYGSELFFTRGYDAILAQTQIFDDGTAVGPAKIVGVGLNSTWAMDDLVVNNLGQAYVAIPLQDMIARFNGGGIESVLVAGNINSTEIAEPTSLAFRRKYGSVVNERVLYVATGGAIANPVDGVVTVGRQLVRIEL